MFGHTYYHSLIRKYVTLFGTLFNDIYINHPDDPHNVTRTIKVPISYGPKEKVLARLTADPSLNRMPAIVLPRMSFEIKDMQYAPDRKLNTVGKRYATDASDSSKIKYQYNPVPYDIDFTLSIMVKNADDGTRIVEQILPFFTPEWTTTVELIPELSIVMDIPLVLNDVSVEDDYEGDFENRRSLIWTLNFTMKAYLYGPVRRGTIIKFANTNLFNSLVANDQLATINTRPGLTANGQPTSSANSSVDVVYIFPGDDYGYIITKNDPLL
jgi:hypothetical protein